MNVKVEKRNEDVFELWESNRSALELFGKVSTQWRTMATRAGPLYLGLDYVAVDVVMRRALIDDPEGDLFADLAVMEDAALAAFSEMGLA